MTHYIPTKLIAPPIQRAKPPRIINTGLELRETCLALPRRRINPLATPRNVFRTFPVNVNGQTVLADIVIE